MFNRFSWKCWVSFEIFNHNNVRSTLLLCFLYLHFCLLYVPLYISLISLPYNLDDYSFCSRQFNKRRLFYLTSFTKAIRFEMLNVVCAVWFYYWLSSIAHTRRECNWISKSAMTYKYLGGTHTSANWSIKITGYSCKLGYCLDTVG